MTQAGRFAPSPTGPLHLGNLRTALAAWLGARSTGRRFVVRMEDLDRVTSSAELERLQLRDLDRLGVDHDGEVVRQSERFDRYNEAIAHLHAAGLTYPCYCTRREIAEAPRAPHPDPGGVLPEGAYPGTCRGLGALARAEREAAGRRPAVRLRTEGERVAFDDVIAGHTVGIVDDVVLRRNDGVPAYNLAVVVDDAAQGVDQVVRGDDLLGSTARQIHLARLLGVTVPTYAHVSLVVGDDGARLAKRHGAVTLDDRAAAGEPLDVTRSWLVESLLPASPDPRPPAGTAPLTVADLATVARRFDLAAVPRGPVRPPEPIDTGSDG